MNRFFHLAAKSGSPGHSKIRIWVFLGTLVIRLIYEMGLKIYRIFDTLDNIYDILDEIFNTLRYSCVNPYI